MRLGRFRARLTYLWLLLLDPMLLMPDLMTMWLAEMLLDRLCHFKVSIFTQNKVFTFLR